MYILHDICLKEKDLSVQIDYLVFTRKLCFVIECKNLYGNIEINKNGDFIRTMDVGGRWIKEGIYSPITQNRRHLELMKKMKAEKTNNLISNTLVFEGESALFKELKQYRLTKSREEQIKPYYIYNDKQLNDLIMKMPKNEEQLLEVSGIGPMKVKKYGEDLLFIIKKYLK